MDKTEAPNAAVRGSESNDLLGLPPAYLGDGQTAYAAGIVASWPEHNRARFRTLLFTGKQLERAVAAERERQRKLVEQCRDALAEELSAWDIDPPLHHVKEAHDACVAWLLRA